MSLTDPRIYSFFKPAGISSQDLVAKFKKKLPRKTKVGHFGTLDPFACGLLIIATGRATKFNDLLHELYPKTYLAVGKLGLHTVTGDLTVEPDFRDEKDFLQSVVATKSLSDLSSAFESLKGKYLQAPPHYSASKFQGKALHQWAREGKLIDRPSVERYVHQLDVVKYRFPYVVFRCTVSSGTYVRTLFQDMAKQIQTNGALLALIRENIGPFSMANSLRPNQWKDKELSGIAFQSPVEAFDFEHIELSDFSTKLYRNGQSLDNGHLNGFSPQEGQFLWIKGQGEILGLGQWKQGLLRPQIQLAI